MFEGIVGLLFLAGIGAKALITEDGQELGDKFEVTMQTHICELDENDEPIALDTVTSDDYFW